MNRFTDSQVENEKHNSRSRLYHQPIRRRGCWVLRSALRAAGNV